MGIAEGASSAGACCTTGGGGGKVDGEKFGTEAEEEAGVDGIEEVEDEAEEGGIAQSEVIIRVVYGINSSLVGQSETGSSCNVKIQEEVAVSEIVVEEGEDEDAVEEETVSFSVIQECSSISLTVKRETGLILKILVSKSINSSGKSTLPTCNRISIPAFPLDKY